MRVRGSTERAQSLRGLPPYAQRTLTRAFLRPAADGVPIDERFGSKVHTRETVKAAKILSIETLLAGTLQEPPHAA
jgi:hypothetical protein